MCKGQATALLATRCLRYTVKEEALSVQSGHGAATERGGDTGTEPSLTTLGSFLMKYLKTISAPNNPRMWYFNKIHLFNLNFIPEHSCSV